MSRSAVRCASSRATRPNDRSRSREIERAGCFGGFAVSRFREDAQDRLLRVSVGARVRSLDYSIPSASLTHTRTYTRENTHSSYSLSSRLIVILVAKSLATRTHIYRERTHQASTADIRGLVAWCARFLARSRALSRVSLCTTNTYSLGLLFRCSVVGAQLVT